jgi:hypothetical protein
MQQFCTYGSARGALGNRRPYRDNSRVLGDSPKKHMLSPLFPDAVWAILPKMSLASR